jgi:hypothetical protein
VREFLETVGEWARVRLSMSRLKNNIKILQRACRNFLATKRKRVDLMSKEWQRVEDIHLAAHFKELAEKTIQEEKQKVVDAKAREQNTKVEKFNLVNHSELPRVQRNLVFMLRIQKAML